MMQELVKDLSEYMKSAYERIVRKTKWKLYFERLKANNVKEIFRVDFKTNTIKYYCVSHETPLGDVLMQYATDEIQFETVEDIVEYLYGA